MAGITGYKKIIAVAIVLLLVASMIMADNKIVNEPIVVTKPQKMNPDSTVNVVAADDIQRMNSEFRREIQKLEGRVKQLEQKVTDLEKNQGG
jgi:Skp family chaperone for outer membrane proteins